MSTTSTSQRPSIAIIGGGIAGLTLAIGLLRRNVPVTIYESAHHFGEIGAGVYFQPNAIRAMIGLDPAIKAGLDKVATLNLWPSLEDVYFTYRFGEGEQAGERFYQKRVPGEHAGVHRARFLDEMIKLVPEGIAHFGKRVMRIEEVEGGKVKLMFKDGSEAVHDCIIGADGIHSEVRKYVLGADHPAATPVFSGKYCHRGLVPMEKAISILGEERAVNGQFYMGKNCHLLTFPVEKGKIFNAVAFASCSTWDHEKWVVPSSVKDIQEDFKNFRGPPREILSELEHTDIWAMFDDPPAPTFCKGNAIIIGDAAHATTPHQGSGAGVAVEDAYVLSSLLAHVEAPAQIQACFEAFNAIRRERGLKLVATSREAGLVWEQEHPEIGEDLEKMKADIDVRQNWLWNVDLEAEIKDGLRMMST